MLNKLTGLASNLVAKALNYFDIRGKQGNWLLRLASLDRVKPVDGLREIGVRGEAIDGIGRNHRDAARKQNLCGGLKPFFITLYNSHLWNKTTKYTKHTKKIYMIYTFYTAKSSSNSRAASFTSSTQGRFL